MAKNKLSYFMHSKEPEIVKYPAPEGYIDENGKRIELEFRVLSEEEMRDIREHWREKKLVKDHGKPMVVNGAPVYETNYDSESALREMLIESLQYPNLKDEELMDYYGVVDVMVMPFKVFPKSAELLEVYRAFNVIHGFTEEDGEEVSDLDAAKN